MSEQNRRLGVEWKRGGGITVSWGGIFDIERGDMGHAEPCELARRLPADVRRELAGHLADLADALNLAEAEGLRP
jgi:hypothetical protein